MFMPHYAVLRDYDLDLDADDIRGAILEDRSGNRLGTVTDAIIEHDSGDVRYLIAAIGAREVLVPARRILASSNDDTVQTDLTLSEAERLPTAEESGVLQGRGTPGATSNRETQSTSQYRADN